MKSTALKENDMANETQLRSFGYGLLMFASTLVLLHELHLGLPVWAVFVIFGVLIFLLEKRESLPFLFWIWQAAVLLWSAFTIVGPGYKTLSLFILIAAIAVGVLTKVKLSAVEVIYKPWMKVAHCIGTIVSTLLFGAFFYIVFAPIGVLLRIMKKDFLSRTLDPHAKSYWIDRKDGEVDKERYEKQF